MLRSPGFPQQYAPNTLCRWIIGDAGKIVRIQFIAIGIEPDPNCQWDFIEFTTDFGEPERQCGNEVPDLLRFAIKKALWSL